MIASTLGRLALCVLAEAARQALPLIVRIAVQRCLKRKSEKDKE